MNSVNTLRAKFKYNSFLLYLFLVLFTSIVHSQDDNQLWTNFALNAPLDKKFSIGGDVGVRGLTSNRNWNQILIRPTAKYRIKKIFKVSAGLALFSTLNQDANNVNEFRLNQDFDVAWPKFKWGKLFFRARLEERWFFYKELPNNFSFRGRVLGGIQTKNLTFLGEKRPIYFKLMLEGFIPFERDVAEVFVNNFRWYTAFGHRISQDFRYELHYIRQISKLFDSSGMTTPQNIFRLRLFYTIDPKQDQIDDEVENPD